jgi:hypothetical protein
MFHRRQLFEMSIIKGLGYLKARSILLCYVMSVGYGGP